MGGHFVQHLIGSEEHEHVPAKPGGERDDQLGQPSGKLRVVGSAAVPDGGKDLALERKRGRKRGRAYVAGVEPQRVEQGTEVITGAKRGRRE